MPRKEMFCGIEIMVPTDEERAARPALPPGEKRNMPDPTEPVKLTERFAHRW